MYFIVGDSTPAVASNLLHVQRVGKFSQSPLFIKVANRRVHSAYGSRLPNVVFG
jgi:hypothetical protein